MVASVMPETWTEMGTDKKDTPGSTRSLYVNWLEGLGPLSQHVACGQSGDKMSVLLITQGSKMHDVSLNCRLRPRLISLHTRLRKGLQEADPT